MAVMLGAFEQAVLLAIVRLREEAYGRAILREVQARLDRTVAAGAVHVTLNRLEHRAILLSEIGAGTELRAGRPRRYYALTTAGRLALNQAHEGVHQLWRGYKPLRGNA
jgi:PadR family transcriptional regulator, regulatory protein PadR